MSEHVKQIFQSQHKVEVFKLMELTDKVRYTHCHEYMTCNLVHYQCGRIIHLVNEDSRHQGFKYNVMWSINLHPLILLR